MTTDILIMSYVLLLVLLVYQAEKFERNSLKIIIIGILLTPLSGFAICFYLGRKELEKSKMQTPIRNS